jgi:hypothetical protein
MIAELLGQIPYFNHGCAISLAFEWTVEKWQHPTITVSSAGSKDRWPIIEMAAGGAWHGHDRPGYGWQTHPVLTIVACKTGKK